MKKLILAYNPVSGHAAFKKKLDGIIAAFQKRNIMVIPYRTRKDNRGFFADFAETAHADGIIAAGGDGTVHMVVNLMRQAHLDLPLAILGSGTSNDFATNLHINDNLEEYFDTIRDGRTRRVDLGKVGDTYFINVASAGMMTGIAHEVNVRMKNALGKMAYYIRGVGELPKFRSLPLKIEADEATYETEAYLFVVINSATVGSMKNVASTARVDDGRLDLLAVEKCSVPQIMKISADLIAGKPVDHHEHVLHIQSRHFRISSSVELQSDLDGEIGPMLPLEIQTIPQALEVYC